MSTHEADGPSRQAVPKLTGEELVTLARDADPLVEFADPSSEAALRDAEERLGVHLPHQLRALLLQSDGATIGMEYHGEVMNRVSTLVWSVVEILKENLTFPDLYDGFEGTKDLLFFANAGVDGILFRHRLDGGALQDEVVVWRPIEGTVGPIAPSFGRYLKGWLAGELKV